MTVPEDTYLSLFRVISGDTRQSKATLLILQGKLFRIAEDSREFKTIFLILHQSQPQPNSHKENDEELTLSAPHPHDY